MPYTVIMKLRKNESKFLSSFLGLGTTKEKVRGDVQGKMKLYRYLTQIKSEF